MKILSIGLALPLLALLACKKNHPEPVAEAVNINYPAAYVVNGESNSISVIDLSKNEVSATLELGMTSGGHHMRIASTSAVSKMWPHHIYLSPDKSKISIAFPNMDLSGGHEGGMDGMKGAIGIYDAVSGMEHYSIELPSMNHNATYSPDGKEIWTSQMMEMGTVQVYDAITYTLKKTISVGAMPAEVTFSHDGSTVFVANGMDSTVTAIDPVSKSVKATIKVGANPVGAWVSADNNVYVDNEKGQSISIINVPALSVTGTISLGFMPGYVTYLTHMGTAELWVTDPENGKVHWWVKDAMGWMHGGAFVSGAGAHAIAINSSGTTAYVTNQLAASVSVINVMDHSKIKEITVGKKPNGIIIK